MRRLIPKSIRLGGSERYTRLFSTKSEDALSLRSGCVVLKKGESIGEHNTGDSEEILIILKGRGELYFKSAQAISEKTKKKIEDKYKRLELNKYSAAYVPPKTIHDVKNIGGSPLKYVFVTCPAFRRQQQGII